MSAINDISEKQAIVGKRRFGFIGSGKMAQAICGGLLRSGILKDSQVTLSDIMQPNEGTLFKPIAELKEKYGVEYLQENKQLAKTSDVVFICVKPNYVTTVLSECKDLLEGKLVVSIANGITVENLESNLHASTHVIRTMPNTPCLVQEGAILLARGTKATEHDVVLMKTLLSVVCPVIEELPEYLFNAATAVSGCGPAYIFMVIEAMADGGVRFGLPRAISQRLAIQTVMGAAKLARDSGVHPAQLREEVCSPGGSTIAGTYVLEKHGIRAAFNECIEAAKVKSDSV